MTVAKIRSGIVYVGEGHEGDQLHIFAGRLVVMNQNHEPLILVANPDGSECLELLNPEKPETSS